MTEPSYGLWPPGSLAAVLAVGCAVFDVAGDALTMRAGIVASANSGSTGVYSFRLAPPTGVHAEDLAVSAVAMHAAASRPCTCVLADGEGGSVDLVVFVWDADGAAADPTQVSVAVFAAAAS